MELTSSVRKGVSTFGFPIKYLLLFWKLVYTGNLILSRADEKKLCHINHPEVVVVSYEENEPGKAQLH
jgi:hypothetical protein